MRTSYGHVTRYVSRQVWALEEGKLDEIVEILRMRAAGITLSSDEIQARVGARAEAPGLTRRGGVAVLPLHGVLAPKMTMMTAISGGTSLERWQAEFLALVHDPSVSAIVCDIDSPGGSVHLLAETFTTVFEARGTKPLVAVVNPVCASAALYIAAAFEEIVCTPSGEVGSVGCYCVHEDWSKANELIGVKPTYISYGRFKVETNQDTPLEDEARQYLQTRVDQLGAEFERALAKGRGVSVTHVREQFGQGRMLFAKEAKAAGLVDRVATLTETLDRLAGRRPRTASAAAGGEAGPTIEADGAAPAVEESAAGEPAMPAAAKDAFARPSAREQLRQTLAILEAADTNHGA